MTENVLWCTPLWANIGRHHLANISAAGKTAFRQRWLDEKCLQGWVQGFMHRHKELSFISVARAKSFNPQTVNKFFDLFEAVMDKYKFPQQRILNCDETGITTVQGKPSKVLAKTGRRQVGGLVSAERGQLVLVEICMYEHNRDIYSTPFCFSQS